MLGDSQIKSIRPSSIYIFFNFKWSNFVIELSLFQSYSIIGVKMKHFRVNMKLFGIKIEHSGIKMEHFRVKMEQWI